MGPNEIFIQVKPAQAAALVKHALTQAGFKITGEGSILIPNAPRDMWVIPPEGMHIDEFKYVPSTGETT